MSLGQKSIYSSFLKVNDSSEAVYFFIFFFVCVCTCMLIQSTGILELPKHRNGNKHFVAYRKYFFRICL